MKRIVAGSGTCLLVLMILIYIIVVTKGGANGVKENELDETPSVDYILVEDEYTRKGISIKFPQLLNDSNDKIKTKINDLIKHQVYGDLEKYTDEELDDFIINYDYQIMWKGDDLLSIQYTGGVNIFMLSYAGHEFHSININMNTGENISFADLIKVDDRFVQSFRNSTLVSGIEEGKHVLGSFDDQFWIEQFQKVDETSQVSFYFTEDSLGISVHVSKSAGYHAEFEIKYKDLEDNIIENEIWKDLQL
jgi:hypothetical protein